MLVDAVTLGDEWLGWDAAAEGHLLAPLDVARRTDGHDVALPVCVERVADLLTRRSSGGPPLAAGESVTVGVSLLRGCLQLLEHPEAAGEWWLTDAGRPVLATDAVDRPALDETASLLATLAAGASRPEAWRDAISAIAAPRMTRSDIERAEQALFHIADPLPLVTSAAAPRTAREVAVYERAEPSVAGESVRPALWESLTRHVDADLADLVSRTTTALWRRSRTPREPRRAPWLVGGAAAVAVLSFGLLWPSGGDGTATADAPASTSPARASTPGIAESAPAAAASSDAAAAGLDADLAAITAGLLDRRRACESDPDCTAALTIDPSATFTAGPIDLPGDERSIALLDDFGGVAVLRVEAADRADSAQLVVIVRSDDEWLLRDVHDVAQQP